MNPKNYTINPEGKYRKPMERPKENIEGGEIKKLLDEKAYQKEVEEIERQNRAIG